MDIIFYRASAGDRWDKFIALWTRGIYSHCELLFSDGMCFSSSPRDGGTRFKKIELNPNNWDYIGIDVTQFQEEKLRKWCEGKKGLPYDWMGILGVAIRNPKLENKNKWFCSEICITAMYQCEIHGFYMIKPRISPNRFFRELKKIQSLISYEI